MKKKLFKKLSTLSLHITLFIFFACFTPTVICKKILIHDYANEPFHIITPTHEQSALKVSTTTKNHTYKNKKKPWTFVVYMAAKNDLRPFALPNIKQLTEVGSNQFINILVHMDIQLTGNTKSTITRRYYIEKGQVIHVNANDPLSQQMDSGDPNTLISCCNWAFGNYPADDYALILWNHGTGCLDPIRGGVFNAATLFKFNPQINKLELDRTLGFMDLIDGHITQQRGICWDDVTGNYLNNQKLEFALKNITQGVLKGQKLSIVGFDACLMSMIEVGSLLKPYARFMLGSQEVELGAGWKYSTALAPFATRTISPEEFALNVVNAYAQCYSLITNDFTQSAINLENLQHLENIIHDIGLLLSEALQKQAGNSVKKAIWASHNKTVCTTFDEISYKDIYHLLCNLQYNLAQFQLIKKDEERNIKIHLNNLLEKGKLCLEQTVLISRSGKNLSKAKGLSIYLPDYKIHPSYPLTNFAKTNSWYAFLQQYITT